MLFKGRWRARRAAGEPVRTFQRPKDRRPRPKRWADAVDQLRTLQAEYEAWRDQLPESLADSRTAELLEGVCDVDLDTLDVELLPRFRPRPIGGAGGPSCRLWGEQAQSCSVVVPPPPRPSAHPPSAAAGSGSAAQ